MSLLVVERPYLECGACNCLPGTCAVKTRLLENERREIVERVLSWPQTETAFAQPVLKNRKQRRLEARLARRGPPAKRRW